LDSAIWLLCDMVCRAEGRMEEVRLYFWFAESTSMALHCDRA